MVDVCLRVRVPRKVYFLFVNKCKFYDLEIREVITELLERFVDGDFDEDFDIPVD